METLSLIQFFYFFAYACFGQLFSIAMQQVKYGNKIKAYGGFSLLVWVNENGWRAVLTICCMVAGVLFTEQLSGSPLSAWSAFLSGFATDKIIDSLVNRKK
jgi:hypothetical protein